MKIAWNDLLTAIRNADAIAVNGSVRGVLHDKSVISCGKCSVYEPNVFMYLADHPSLELALSDDGQSVEANGFCIGGLLCDAPTEFRVERITIRVLRVASVTALAAEEPRKWRGPVRGDLERAASEQDAELIDEISGGQGAAGMTDTEREIFGLD